MTHDLTGLRFGKLTAISLHGRVGKNRIWLCQCDCGERSTPSVTNLMSGATKACGKCRNPSPTSYTKKHGDVGTRTYRSWSAMLRRVRHPEQHEYSHVYANVTMDPRWEEYLTFKADMGERPEGMTLDRKDNDKGYWPDNCRWATPTTQTRNRRIARTFTVNGVTKFIAEWAVDAGISYGAAQYRLTRYGKLELTPNRWARVHW